MGGKMIGFINGRMSLGARLVLLTALFAAPVVLLQTAFATYSWRDISFLERELLGVDTLRRTWPAFIKVARQDGEPPARGGVGRAEAEALNAGSEWTRFVITSDRDRVSAGAALISAMADGSNLTLDRDLERFYLSDVTTVRLPALVEATHQLGGTATGLADTPVQANRLVAAYERVAAAAEDLDSAFAKAIRTNPSPAARQSLREARASLARAVESTLRGRELGGEPPAIEGLFQVSDQVWTTSRDELDRLLRAERDRLVRDLTLSVIVVALSVAAALALALVIHRGVTNRISRLMSAMSRLIGGDLSTDVPHLDHRNEIGRIAHTILAFKDSLIERARLEEESVAASRAKSEFLGNISHEIRTPLNGVVGAASALSHTRLDADQRAMVELICASGLTVERLLADVLDLSKIEAGGLQLELAPFDARQVITDATQLFAARAAEKGVDLTLDLADNLRGGFEGDAVRLAQVVSNLVSNAIKFTEQGRVSVRAAIVPSEAAGGCCGLRVVVRDTGAGFDQALAPYLFERFTQADSSISRRYGGSGLGLSICKAIIDMMGGEIGVSSAVGAGSEFRITVPLRRVAEHETVAPAAVEPAAEQGDRPPCILLVEDHEVNRTIVEMLLAPLGVELVMACDGQEGVDRFEERAFDFVLMDMQMPVMDGLAATRKMRSLERKRVSPRTPIVMLTANVSPEHQLAAMAAGADSHLAKPINRERLWEVIVGRGTGGFGYASAP